MKIAGQECSVEQAYEQLSANESLVEKLESTAEERVRLATYVTLRAHHDLSVRALRRAEGVLMKGDGWNRLFNYQRDALAKLSVWTTEDDRRRALSYVDRSFDAQGALDAVKTGLPAPRDLGVIVAAARYEDAGWMPDGCFDRWRRWVTRGTEQRSVPDLVQWLGDVEKELRQKHYLAMPEGLSETGQHAHAIIVTYLKEHGCVDTGSRLFYTPAEWVKKGNEYGSRSHLVVAYDGGGKLREVFSMDAAYAVDCAHYQQTGKSREPYVLYEGMQAKLRAAGLYFEECTNWFSAVYSI